MKILWHDSKHAEDIIVIRREPHKRLPSYCTQEKDGDFPRFFVVFFLAEVSKTKNTDKRNLFFFAKINSITKDFFFL